MDPPRPLLAVTVDGRPVSVPAGRSVLEACRVAGSEVPTLCFLETLTPVNVCRVCVVEVEGSRTLVPACSRVVEAGMVITTDSERARHSRRLVFELLASSVDLSLVGEETEAWMEAAAVDGGRFGQEAATVAQPAKVQDDL
ncbi:MAG: Fe-S-binding domain-containing protein, partial [Actinobacteria bacterium]